MTLIRTLTVGLSLCLLAGCADTPRVADAPVSTSMRFAPYYAGQPHADVDDWMHATGGNYLTLAFYNSAGGCAGQWHGDEKPLIALAEKLRARGGQVIVSSGGWNPLDIADSCKDPEKIADVYEGVLTRLGTPYLDIDAEPGDVHNNLARDIVDRRAAALKILQDRFAAKGKPLHISFTLAIRPAFGYDAENFYLLQSAVNAGVTIDVVNPMIMDYRDGTEGPLMGTRSIMAIEKGMAQVKSLLPGKTEAEIWAMTAATPMLGQNDAEAEIFTLDDAQKLLEFARTKGMARLSFWSLDRDNGACPGKRKADPTCSGLQQENWAFSRILGSYAGR